MRIFVAFVALVSFAIVGQCGDQPLPWSQFRGPNGSGVAEGQKPPIEFGPDKNLKWKVPAPSGMSSPIIAGKLLIIG